MYKIVLEGDEIKNFISGFYTMPKTEEKYNIAEEDIKENFNLKLLRENGLGRLATKFLCVPYKAIDFAYPGRFKLSYLYFLSISRKNLYKKYVRI